MPPTYKHTRIRTHARTHRTHARARARAHARTHAHTHTHTARLMTSMTARMLCGKKPSSCNYFYNHHDTYYFYLRYLLFLSAGRSPGAAGGGGGHRQGSRSLHRHALYTAALVTPPRSLHRSPGSGRARVLIRGPGACCRSPLPPLSLLSAR